MARIIVIVNQKGGTGKTTTAINLGTALAAKGKKVLLVDLDPQANATSGLGIRPENLALSLYHAMIGKVPTRDVLRGTGFFNYDLLPASQDLAGATIELLELPEREFQLAKTLESVKDEYDYLLIDSPPSLGLLTVNGLVAADAIFIPVQSEYFALQGLTGLLDTIGLIKKNLGVDPVLLGAVLTMYDRRNRSDRDVAKQLRRTFPGYVFDVVIPRNVHLAEAPYAGKPIFQHAQGSPGAHAYRRLAEEFLMRMDANDNNANG